MSGGAIVAVGLFGQALFAARTVLQWIASERAGRSIVPRWFWQLSLFASVFVIAYATVVGNWIFLLTLLPAVFVYGRMLMLQRSGGGLLLVLAVPVVSLSVWAALRQPLSGPAWITAMGLAGWLLWTSRFPLQWWISERRGVPGLGVAFWSVSLVSALLLLVYALWHQDWVMVLAFATGPVVYVRNLMLIGRTRGAADEELAPAVDLAHM